MNPSRGTPSMRLHGLDTLRALAIVVVMLYHLNMQGLLPSSISPIAKIGWVGVDLFFVLSGFLIGSQLFKPYLAGRHPSLRDFYTRRAYRILPAFSLSCCCICSCRYGAKLPARMLAGNTRALRGISCSLVTPRVARFLTSSRYALKNTSTWFSQSCSFS